MTPSEQLARAHARDLKHRHTMVALESAIVRKSVGVLTSAGFGSMKLLGVPDAVKGFPWKLGVWTLATLTEVMTRGGLQQAASGLADATLHVFTYNAVVHKSYVGQGDGAEV